MSLEQIIFIFSIKLVTDNTHYEFQREMDTDFKSTVADLFINTKSNLLNITSV